MTGIILRLSISIVLTVIMLLFSECYIGWLFVINILLMIISLDIYNGNKFKYHEVSIYTLFMVLLIGFIIYSKPCMDTDVLLM